MIRSSFCLLLLLFISPCFSQQLRIVEINSGTANAELHLIRSKDGRDEVIESFKQYPILFFHNSYYIDESNNAVYFLYSYCTATGNGGKMGFRYYLEKFDVTTEKILFTTSCEVTECYPNVNIFRINNEGFLEKKFDGVVTRKALSGLGPNDDWCDGLSH